jgi:UDP-GlcNAc:undecaprenyl-phosphate GlcNAc-1-phosphate transferase
MYYFIVSIFLIIGIVVLTALLCVVLVPVLKKYAGAWGLVDVPSERRIHKVPIPRCGGIAVFLATHIVLAVLVLFSFSDDGKAVAMWLQLLVGSSVLVGIGLADDCFSISAWVKLGGQLFVATLMFLFGYSFESMLGQPLLPIVDFLLTLFWFALLMNAFNLIDGVDGICGGLGLIAAVTVGILLIVLGQHFAGLVLLALAGACLGFLRYNFHPASIFLGDAGSLFIGFLLAAVSLKTNVNKSTFISILLPILIMCVPIFDVFLAVWRRVGRRLLYVQLGDMNESRVFGPDLDHLHHRLLRLGFSQTKVALMLYSAATVASVTALGFTLLSEHSASFLVVGLLVLLNIVFRRIVHIEFWTTSQWILHAIRRPLGLKRMCIHMTHDLLVLLGISYFVMKMYGRLEEPNVIGLLLLGTLVPFGILVLFRNYITIWSKARPWQFWKLMMELVVGEILFALMSNYMRENIMGEMIRFHGTRMVLLMILIIFSRTLPHIIRDSASWLRRYQTNDSHFRTVIIGSGYELSAYLRRAAYRKSHLIERKIIGIFDNDQSLAGMVVFGYPVLGSYDDVANAIVERDVTEIIICDEQFQKEHEQKCMQWDRQGIAVKLYYSDVLQLGDEVAMRKSA